MFLYVTVKDTQLIPKWGLANIKMKGELPKSACQEKSSFSPNREERSQQTGVARVKKRDSQSSTSISAGKMLSNMGMQIEETEVLCRGGEGFGGSMWVSYDSPYRVNEELQTPVACFATGNIAILLKISPGKCCI